MIKPWPKPSPKKYEAFDEGYPGAGWNDWHFTVIKPSTCCKHGQGECELCGTTDRRDYKHRTRGGKGVVARIPK